MYRPTHLLPCLLLLAGCATPQPIVTDSAFDGPYSGLSTNTRGGGVCGPVSEPVRVAIQNGTFRFPFYAANPYSNLNAVVPIEVHVTAGGTLKGASPYYADDPMSRQGWREAWITFSGRVTAGGLDADITSLNCSRHLSLQRG